MHGDSVVVLIGAYRADKVSVSQRRRGGGRRASHPLHGPVRLGDETRLFKGGAQVPRACGDLNGEISAFGALEKPLHYGNSRTRATRSYLG
jgi:hypothetical protein